MEKGNKQDLQEKYYDEGIILFVRQFMNLQRTGVFC